MATSSLSLLPVLTLDPDDAVLVPRVEAVLAEQGISGLAASTLGLPAEAVGLVVTVLAADIQRRLNDIVAQHYAALSGQEASMKAYRLSVVDAQAFGRQQPWPAPGQTVDPKAPVTLPSLANLPYVGLETVLVCREELQRWVDRVNRAILAGQDDIDSEPSEAERVVAEVTGKVRGYTERLLQEIWPKLALLNIVRTQGPAIADMTAHVETASTSLRNGGVPAFGDDFRLFTAFVSREKIVKGK